jgi:hypothetical protein
MILLLVLSHRLFVLPLSGERQPGMNAGNVTPDRDPGSIKNPWIPAIRCAPAGMTHPCHAARDAASISGSPLRSIGPTT